MKETCRVLGGVALVLGVIGTIVLAVAGGKMDAYNTSIDRNWPLTIGYLLGGGMFTAFTVTVFFTLAEILETLEGVKYFQNEILGNIHAMDQRSSAVANSSGSVGASDSNTNISNATSSISNFSDKGGWTCPECNRKNRSFENSCQCGYEKL